MWIEKSDTWNPAKTAWRITCRRLYGPWCYSRTDAVVKWFQAVLHLPPFHIVSMKKTKKRKDK
jgi:hypothetical protein